MLNTSPSMPSTVAAEHEPVDQIVHVVELPGLGPWVMARRSLRSAFTMISGITRSGLCAGP